MSIRCRLGFHHWQYEKRGQLHQGSVYPALFRYCKRCQLRQQEVYQEQHNEAYWADSNSRDAQTSKSFDADGQ